VASCPYCNPTKTKQSPAASRIGALQIGVSIERRSILAAAAARASSRFSRWSIESWRVPLRARSSATVRRVRFIGLLRLGSEP
jgi:hypothetical protein